MFEQNQERMFIEKIGYLQSRETNQGRNREASFTLFMTVNNKKNYSNNSSYSEKMFVRKVGLYVTIYRL